MANPRPAEMRGTKKTIAWLAYLVIFWSLFALTVAGLAASFTGRLRLFGERSCQGCRKLAGVLETSLSEDQVCWIQNEAHPIKHFLDPEFCLKQKELIGAHIEISGPYVSCRKALGAQLEGSKCLAVIDWKVRE